MLFKGNTIVKGVGEAFDANNPSTVYEVLSSITDSYAVGFRVGAFSSAAVLGSLYLAKCIKDRAKRTDEY